MKKRVLTVALLSLFALGGCAGGWNGEWDAVQNNNFGSDTTAQGSTEQTGSAGSAVQSQPAASGGTGSDAEASESDDRESRDSAEVNEQKESETEEEKEPEEEALLLEDVVICLDPGHGVTSKTAQERMSPKSQQTKSAYVSGASGKQQTEEELNLAVAKKAKKKLEELGASVILTRTTHAAAVSNIERAEIANKAEAALCVRIHADGSADSSVYGASMLVPAGDLLGTPSIVKPSCQAGAIILEQVVKQTGARNRGIVQREDLTGFNWSEVPCVLLEMGFVTNDAEDARLKTDSYRNKIARGIADGVLLWWQEQG